MTREEELQQAVDNFSEAHKYDGCLDYLSMGIAFEAGAQWADVHPDLFSLWHDASEEPELGSNIVVVDKNGQWWDIQPYDGEYDGYGDLVGWRCCVVHYNDIKHWAYINDLLPKTKEL